jgi:hypothetical protein
MASHQAPSWISLTSPASKAAKATDLFDDGREVQRKLQLFAATHVDRGLDDEYLISRLSDFFCFCPRVAAVS